MQKKSLVITIISAVVVIGLMITGGVLLFAPKASNSTPAPSSTGQVTQQPGGTSDPIPSTLPSATPSEAPEKAKQEFEQSKTFKDAKAVSGFSADDVKNILSESVDYTYANLTGHYFLGGEWGKTRDMAALDSYIGPFFNSEIRQKIKAFPADKDVAKNVFPLVFFFMPNENITASPACARDINEANKASISCPLDGVSLTDMTYTPTVSEGVPGVRVEYTASAKIPVLMDGKNAYTTVTYKYNLNFIRNTSYETNTNPKKFVMNFYDVNINIDKVEALNG